jgi:hypothetical protein
VTADIPHLQEVRNKWDSSIKKHFNRTAVIDHFNKYLKINLIFPCRQGVHVDYSAFSLQAKG